MPRRKISMDPAECISIDNSKKHNRQKDSANSRSSGIFCFWECTALAIYIIEGHVLDLF